MPAERQRPVTERARIYSVMYHRKSRLESLIIMALDCICITVSLILAT